MPLATYFSLFYNPTVDNYAEVRSRAAPAVHYATTFLSPTSVRLDFAPADIPGATVPSAVSLPPLIRPLVPPPFQPPRAPQTLIVSFAGGGALTPTPKGSWRDTPTLAGSGAFVARMSALTSPD